jgi:predicted nucleic acid-binding protein
MPILRHGSALSGRATRVAPADVATLLLDSTVLIDALRGHPGAERIVQLRHTGIEPWVCVISIEEITRGLRPSEEPAVRRLFSGLGLAPLGVAEGMKAGTWRREFAERGVTLHQADCLIAAAAAAAATVGVGPSLATANVSDFPMPGIEVERWS